MPCERLLKRRTPKAKSISFRLQIAILAWKRSNCNHCGDVIPSFLKITWIALTNNPTKQSLCEPSHNGQVCFQKVTVEPRGRATEGEVVESFQALVRDILPFENLQKTKRFSKKITLQLEVWTLIIQSLWWHLHLRWFLHLTACSQSNTMHKNPLQHFYCWANGPKSGMVMFYRRLW